MNNRSNKNPQPQTGQGSVQDNDSRKRVSDEQVPQDRLKDGTNDLQSGKDADTVQSEKASGKNNNG